MSQTGYPFIKIKIFPFNLSSLKGSIIGGQMLNGKCESFVSHKPSTINQGGNIARKKQRTKEAPVAIAKHPVQRHTEKKKKKF